jgi:hypothetical protein
MGRVSSYVAEAFPQAAVDSIEIPVLSIERTFWEKATILHAEAHREVGKPIPPRFSRHYADTAALSAHEAGRRAIGRDDLLARVVAHKQVFFAQSWARYETAVRGSFRLIPSAESLRWLEQDYRAMRDMFFRTPPSWAEVVDRLRDLEKTINSK